MGSDLLSLLPHLPPVDAVGPDRCSLRKRARELKAQTGLRNLGLRVRADGPDKFRVRDSACGVCGCFGEGQQQQM